MNRLKKYRVKLYIQNRVSRLDRRKGLRTPETKESKLIK